VQLQVLDSSYKAHADNNAFMEKVIYPSRGLIYDRNGKLVVYNTPEYDLMMIPKDVTPFDTVDFCNTLQISRDEFNQRWQEMRKGRNYSAFTQQVFMHHLTPEDYGRLQEKLYRTRIPAGADLTPYLQADGSLCILCLAEAFGYESADSLD
jgi:penicillin-binding protein 2